MESLTTEQISTIAAWFVGLGDTDTQAEIESQFATINAASINWKWLQLLAAQAGI